MNEIRDILNGEGDELRKASLEKELMAGLLLKYDVLKISDTNTVHVNHVGMARLILEHEKHNFCTIEDENCSKQEIYYYEDGYYHRNGELKIKMLVDKYLDIHTSIHRKNEVTDYIRNRRLVKRRDLEPPLNLINLKNGVLDIDNMTLLPHSPCYYFLNQLPVEYNPSADCPNIKKFFEDVLYPDYIDLMQELFGYILYREYKLHRAFMFLGGGRNGKGVTIQLMEHFVGDYNYSTIPLHDLSERAFSKSSLYGKLVNLGAEISGRSMKETSDFKNLTGGEPITGEKKYFDAFSFTNYAKLIFNANTLPRNYNDKTKAFYDRWIIFPFPKTFEMEDKATDPDILDKLTTKEELEGLLNWALVGLKRLLTNKKFSYKVVEDMDGERYDTLMKPERQFVFDYLVEFEGAEIEKDEIYCMYEKWAKHNKFTVVTKNAFSRSVKDAYKKLVIKNTRKGSVPVGMYVNVYWNEQKQEELNKERLVQTNIISDEEKTVHAEKMYCVDEKKEDIEKDGIDL